jgi:hypothetical protein
MSEIFLILIKKRSIGALRIDLTKQILNEKLSLLPIKL